MHLSRSPSSKRRSNGSRAHEVLGAPGRCARASTRPTAGRARGRAGSRTRSRSRRGRGRSRSRSCRRSSGSRAPRSAGTPRWGGGRSRPDPRRSRSRRRRSRRSPSRLASSAGQVAVDVGDHRDAVQLAAPFGLVHVEEIGGGNERLDQLPHAVVELVADPPARPRSAARRDRPPASPGSACPDTPGRHRRTPSVTTTSAALTTSSVSGLGNSARRRARSPPSPPRRRGRSARPGCRAGGANRRPSRLDSLWARHAAIWLRPALCSHTNNTSGSGFSTTPSAWATARSRSRANRSMITGKKFGPTVGRSPISA